MDTRVRSSIKFVAALFTGALVALAMPAYGEGRSGGHGGGGHGGGGEGGHSFSGGSWGGGGEHGGGWSRGEGGAGREMRGSDRGFQGNFGTVAPREVGPRVDRDDVLRRDRDDFRFRGDRDDFRFRGGDVCSGDDWRFRGFTDLDRRTWTNDRLCSNDVVPFRHGEGDRERDEGGEQGHRHD